MVNHYVELNILYNDILLLENIDILKLYSVVVLSNGQNFLTF